MKGMVLRSRSEDFEFSQEGELRIIKPHRDLAAEVSETFRRILLNQLPVREGVYRIDLAQVGYMDTASVSSLACFVRMARHHYSRAKLEVIGVNEAVGRELKAADINFSS
ncbi:MAG: STAS domain-containing protein [Planctomycetes bacterium]|nr:STAS domain-containing protein [Planctomycetota bacterium]